MPLQQSIDNFIDDNLSIINNSKIFLAQLETSIRCYDCMLLNWQKKNGCTTILNPAPATNLPEDCFENVDFFTPNETEAGFFINQSIESEKDCQSAAKVFLDKGNKKHFDNFRRKRMFL